MPVIPNVQQGQILNAGSPVPIASPEEARGEGRAIAGFGEAISQIGGTLAGIANAQEKKTQEYNAALLYEQGREKAMARMAESIQAAPIDGDTTGYKQVEAFRQNANADLDEMLAEVQDPNMRLRVKASLANHINDVSAQVFAKEVVKKAKHAEATKAQLFSSLTKSVAADPAEIDRATGTMEKIILEDPDIPGKIKPTMIADMKKEFLRSAIEGQVSLGTPAAFSTATKLLEDKFAGVMDVKEKSKLAKYIRDQRYATASQRMAIESKSIALQNAREKEESKANATYLSTAFSLAGTDETKRAPLIAQAERLVQEGKLDYRTKQALTGEKRYKPEQESFYKTLVAQSLAMKQDPTALADKVLDDMGQDQGVGPETATQLHTSIKTFSDRKKSDPVFAQELKNGETEIKNLGLGTNVSNMSLGERGNYLANVAGAQQELYEKLLDNPKASPAILAGEIIERRFGVDAKYSKFVTTESIAAEKLRIYTEAKQREMKGLLSDEDRKKISQEYINLDKREKVLNATQKIRGSK